MLWIISGSTRSGKNTLRNILARDYGFQVIKKYVELETARSTFQYIDHDGKAILGAIRDPFLVTGNKNAEDMIERLKKKEIEKEDVTTYFIYEKSGDKYYFIDVEDIKKAILEDNKNYVLVCSEPETVQRIKEINVTLPNSSEDLEKNMKMQRIKTVLVFGLHIKDTERKDKKGTDDKVVQATEKYAEYFAGMSNYTNIFDFVIYNKHSDSKNEFLRDEWDKMYIKFAQTFDNKHTSEKADYQPFCYKLTSPKSDNTFNSGVFFIKPFINKESTTRPAIVLDAINKKIEEIAGALEIKLQRDGKPLDYKLSSAVPVEYIQGCKDPWGQMRKQIEKANLIIADVADINDSGTSMHKPNCYWELGYARALHKEIIVLVDENAGRVAFDEQDRIYIKYHIDEKNYIDEKNKQPQKHYVFAEKGIMRKDLGDTNDSPYSDDRYSFENQVKLFYTRMREVIKIGFFNELILLNAAEKEKEENRK